VAIFFPVIKALEELVIKALVQRRRKEWCQGIPFGHKVLPIQHSYIDDEADLGTCLGGAVDSFKLKLGTSTTDAGLLLSSGLLSLCNLPCHQQSISLAHSKAVLIAKTSSCSASPRRIEKVLTYIQIFILPLPHRPTV
jgi:hypothetical protein